MIPCPICGTCPRGDVIVPMVGPCACGRFRCVPRTRTVIHDLLEITGFDWEFKADGVWPYGLSFADGQLSEVEPSGTGLRARNIPPDEAEAAVARWIRIAVAHDVMDS